MPTVLITLITASTLMAAIGTGVIYAIHRTAPVAATHAAILEACNGPVEIGAIVGANSAAAATMKSATQTTGTITQGATPLPIVARVSGSTYVVTVGSGSNARTCAVPLQARSL